MRLLPLTRSCLVLCCLLSIRVHSAATMAAETASPNLDPYNVVWTTPSVDSRGSMPLGNGDICLNAWVESGGDLVFYVAKTDAWGNDIFGSYGLPKVGRVRVKLDPNPCAAGEPFQQTLRLQDGDVTISAGDPAHKVNLDLWVDANNPVIHLDGYSAQPEKVQVLIDSYRMTAAHSLNADTIFPANSNSICWCNRDTNTTQPELTNRTFGAVIEGDGLTSAGDTTLQSSAGQTQIHVRITPLIAQTDTPAEWENLAGKQAAQLASENPARARNLDLAWWRDFWNRSWVIVTGNADADKVTSSYILQRFITACAGRGAYPIKFNGTLFTTDYTVSHNNKGVKTTEDVDADYRSWGGQYWFQNTRAMYWPMLQSGDFDMMQPLFRMYLNKLPVNEKLTEEYYSHDGAYFPETAPFWGWIPDILPTDPGLFTRHYFTPILEISVMMLDYYYYTGDANFARTTLLPIADDGATFFDKHFPRDANGKLDLKPDNAIETYWAVEDPAPDIAGLHYVLQRLLALPPSIGSQAERDNWRKVLAETPDLPMGTNDGKTVILPFLGATPESHRGNGENPELYAVYPFRIYGLGRPDLQVALDTFGVRQAKGTTCWLQDPIQAAYLGDTALAQQDVTTNFADTSRDTQERFPVFWGPFHDYTPDEDNGGNGMNALQLMLLQPVGDKLLLIPAWPANWNAVFKLHAPQNTVVEGTLAAGKIVSLSVTPSSRRKDVCLVAPDGTLAPCP